MHHFTANLPLLERQILDNPIGKSTSSAMLNGAQFGILKELDGYIQWSRKKFGKIRIILTGGDRDFFVKHLKRRIFAHPNLVLEGLNKILEFNVK